MDNDLEKILEFEKNKTKKSRKIFAKKLANKISLKSYNSLPIKINEVLANITKSYEYKIVVKPKKLSQGFSGMLVEVSKNNFGILYNRIHSKVRQRFTVAHELGHLMLGHKNRVNKPAEIINLKSSNPQEIEANTFAAELLIPKNILKKEIEENGLTKENIKLLAKKFWVSETALWFKLSKDNLI